uniref:DBD_Tnp_Mut domain-containing protein n=1 Tax=Heterorhabditis bacteriophora TaxID=37862 RepID=A0A1I7WNY0_HETBA
MSFDYSHGDKPVIKVVRHEGDDIQTPFEDSSLGKLLGNFNQHFSLKAPSIYSDDSDELFGNDTIVPCHCEVICYSVVKRTLLCCFLNVLSPGSVIPMWDLANSKWIKYYFFKILKAFKLNLIKFSLYEMTLFKCLSSAKPIISKEIVYYYTTDSLESGCHKCYKMYVFDDVISNISGFISPFLGYYRCLFIH